MDISTAVLVLLAIVESGGDRNAIGDDGLALGMYQLHAAYVQDAGEYAGVEWVHEDAFDPRKAEDIIKAYMARYATERRIGRAVTLEDVCRIHKGGLNGYRRDSTLPYWHKVKRLVDRL